MKIAGSERALPFVFPSVHRGRSNETQCQLTGYRLFASVLLDQLAQLGNFSWIAVCNQLPYGNLLYKIPQNVELLGALFAAKEAVHISVFHQLEQGLSRP